MNTNMAKSNDDRPWFWIWAAHLTAGLATGMAFYTAHLFLIADNMTGKPTAAEDAAICWGLLWPVLTTVYAVFRAWMNPLVQLGSFAVTLALTVLLLICVGASGFILVLIAFAGYC